MNSENERWAKILIEQLIQQGVTYFCLSPGSRSTALAIAVAENPRARSLVHFDERGTAFHALGYAKGSGLAAAIITTSGTAVGNLLPAIMESSNDRIPLIVITADRPPELRDCGANQTCDQIKLFANYCRWQVDLPCPTTEITERYLATTISQAVYRAHNDFKGPVHLNCMFREPLFGSTPLRTPSIPITEHERLLSRPHPQTLKKWAQILSQTKQGVIVVGSLPAGQTVDPLISLAHKLNWPILPDLLSQVRGKGKGDEVILHYDALLKGMGDFQPKVILHCGDRLVSKTLQQWLLKFPSIPYLQSADHPCRQDPFHQVTHRISCDPSVLCEEMLPLIQENGDTSWLQSWKAPSNEIHTHLEQIFSDHSELTEPGLIQTLKDNLTPDWALFLANSMPIRDADQFLFPDHPIGPCFGNRGVSGIDGNIATAIGIAQGSQKPTLAVLGDLSFLHDLNSLAQLRTCSVPVLFLIINNQGGAIFSFLPIAQREAIFEEFFATSHPYRFQAAADLFQIPYHSLKEKTEWKEKLCHYLDHPQSVILEIPSDRAQNFQLHQEIIHSVKTCLMSPL